MMKKAIDVSIYQGWIDWEKVKSAGIVHCVVKATQNNWCDPNFIQNIVGASQVGIKVSAYHYLTAQTVRDAIAEADYFVSIVRPYIVNWCVVDVEDDCLPKDKNTLTEIVDAFCERVKALGYAPMVYTNPNFLKWRLNNINWDLWLALWRDKDNVPSKVDYPNIKMWQYGYGTIPGIAYNCDLDLVYESEVEEMTEAEKKDFNALKKRVDELEKEKIYNTETEVRKDFGVDGANAIKYFVSKGILKGESATKYGLKRSEVKSLVWLYRFINR